MDPDSSSVLTLTIDGAAVGSALSLGDCTEGCTSDVSVHLCTWCPSDPLLFIPPPHQLSFTAPSSAGAHTLVVKVTDAVDGTLVDTRTITLNVQSARREVATQARRAMADGASFPTLLTDIRISNGVLSASIDQPLGTETTDSSDSKATTIIAIVGGVGAACLVAIIAVVVVAQRRTERNKVRASVESVLVEFAKTP